MNIQPILDFYHKKISAKEFMDTLNADKELQVEFNKALKNSPPNPKTTTAVEWINKSYENNTEWDDGIRCGDYLIWLLVREYLSKGKNIQYLSQEDINDFILSGITEMSLVYNAEKDVEKFIVNNVISKLGKIESISKAIKESKEIVKTLFVYENKPPRWAQACEWPIENNKPMLFISQKNVGEKVTYTFKDSKSQIKEIVQYY